MKLLVTVVTLTLLVGCTPTVKSEPAAGTLTTGARVYVDDGSCGGGKIKQITGGGKHGNRLTACVAKPT